MPESDGNQHKPPRATTSKEHLCSGLDMQLGEHMYTVPPMLMKDIHASIREGLLTKLSGIQKRVADGEQEADDFAEGLDALVTITHRSLRRNYPEVTKEQIEGFIDVENAERLIAWIFTANKISRKEVDPTIGAADGPSTPQAI